MLSWYITHNYIKYRLGALDCFNLWLCTVVYSTRKKMFVTVVLTTMLLFIPLASAALSIIAYIDK